MFSVSSKLQCYQCGNQQSGTVGHCKQFNATQRFIVDCGPDENACLKGWVSDDGSLYRGCAQIAEDICLLQVLISNPTAGPKS
jgi:hypothetical protein